MKLAKQARIKARIHKPDDAQRPVFWVEALPGLYLKLITAQHIDSKMRGSKINPGTRGFPELVVQRRRKFMYRFKLYRPEQLEVIND